MVTETDIQSMIRVAAANRHSALWRNNNGACRDDTGRMIRYGLGNDSKKLNEVWKSSDLIGITPVMIGPEHVGRVIGVFTAVEVKRESWRKPENKRDRAQEAFLADVLRYGGIAMFANSVEAYQAGGVRYGS